MTNMHYWSLLAQFYLEWAMFRAKVLDKIKHAQFIFSNFLFEIDFVFRSAVSRMQLNDFL